MEPNICIHCHNLDLETCSCKLDPRVDVLWTAFCGDFVFACDQKDADRAAVIKHQIEKESELRGKDGGPNMNNVVRCEYHKSICFLCEHLSLAERRCKIIERADTLRVASCGGYKALDIIPQQVIDAVIGRKAVERTGCWQHDSYYGGFYSCSVCGHDQGYKTRYCPMCGADMAGESEE